MLPKDSEGAQCERVGSSLRQIAHLFRGFFLGSCLGLVWHPATVWGFCCPSEHPGFSFPSAPSPHIPLCMPELHFSPLCQCLSNTNRLSLFANLHVQRLLCWKKSGDGKLDVAAALCWAREGMWCRANCFSNWHSTRLDTFSPSYLSNLPFCCWQ